MFAVFKPAQRVMADNLETARDESRDYWVVDGDLSKIRFDSKGDAEALADRLNLALDPLNSFDEKGNALALNHQ